MSIMKVADALIRGMSLVDCLRDMLCEDALQESSCSLMSRVARVASASNPGDAPSRNEVLKEDGLDWGLARSVEAVLVSRYSHSC